MNLYAINSVLDEKLCEVSPPALPDGIQLGDDDAPSPWGVEYAVSKAYNNYPLADRLIAGSYKLIISGEAKSVIERFATDEYLLFLPTFILNKNGDHLADYFYVVEKYEISAIDYYKSDCVYWDVDESLAQYFETNEEKVRTLNTWVFDEAKLPPFGIFRTPHLTWVANDELKRAIEDECLTGFDFEFLWDSEA